MEKHGAITPGITPPEHEDTAVRAPNTVLSEKTAETELDTIRRLDGDFRKLAAERVKKTL